MLLGWLIAGWGDIVHEVFPALFASTVGYVVVSLLGKPVTEAKVANMFEITRKSHARTA